MNINQLKQLLENETNKPTSNLNQYELGWFNALNFVKQSLSNIDQENDQSIIQKEYPCDNIFD